VSKIKKIYYRASCKTTVIVFLCHSCEYPIRASEQESSEFKGFWTPVFNGVTVLETFARGSIVNIFFIADIYENSLF